jgi:hypothetical protein
VLPFAFAAQNESFNTGAVQDAVKAFKNRKSNG